MRHIQGGIDDMRTGRHLSPEVTPLIELTWRVLAYQSNYWLARRVDRTISSRWE